MPETGDEMGCDVSNDREQELERELTELREAVLTDWITVASQVTDTLNSMQQTLSWRITKPLRVVRVLHRKVEQVGTARAVQIARAQLATKLRRGR